MRRHTGKKSELKDPITRDTIAKMEAIFDELGLEWTEKKLPHYEDEITIEVNNPREPKFKWGFGSTVDSRHMRIACNKTIGYFRFKFYKSEYHFDVCEYTAWPMKATKRYSSMGDRTTSSEKRLLKIARQMKPTDDNYETAYRLIRASNARSRMWSTKRSLSEFAAKHAERAFEVLVESNATIPDDFKDVMNEYLDLVTARDEASSQSDAS